MARRLVLPKAWQRLRREQARTARVSRAISAKPLAASDPDASAAAAGLRYVNDGRLPGIRRLGRRARALRGRRRPHRGRPRRARAASSRWRSRRPGPTCGSARTRAATCRPPAATPAAASSTAITRAGARCATRPSSAGCSSSRRAARAARPRRRRPARGRAAAREGAGDGGARCSRRTLIRVGNEEYARANRSYGLTTHAQPPRRGERARACASSSAARAASPHSVGVQDARLARIVKACRDLPGYELFQYLDDDGERCAASIRPTSTTTCARRAARSSPPRTSAPGRARCSWRARWPTRRAAADGGGRRNGRSCRRSRPAAQRLGNTRAVCRKSYVHPAVLEAFLEGDVIGPANGRAASPRRLSTDEAAVAKLIARRTRAIRRPVRKVA